MFGRTSSPSAVADNAVLASSDLFSLLKSSYSISSCIINILMCLSAWLDTVVEPKSAEDLWRRLGRVTLALQWYDSAFEIAFLASQ